jgi:hypothetical protein
VDEATRVRQIGRIADLDAGAAGARRASAMDGASQSHPRGRKSWFAAEQGRLGLVGSEGLRPLKGTRSASASTTSSARQWGRSRRRISMAFLRSHLTDWQTQGGWRYFGRWHANSSMPVGPEKTIGRLKQGCLNGTLIGGVRQPTLSHDSPWRLTSRCSAARLAALGTSLPVAGAVGDGLHASGRVFP